MANFATLKAAIAAAIKQNGNNEITGALLQQQLLAMVNSLGAGYQYAGIATPSTNPGTPDQNVFYIASTAGTYANFNGLVLADGEIAILKYNGAWTKDVTGAALRKELLPIVITPSLNNLTVEKFNEVLMRRGDVLYSADEIVGVSASNTWSEYRLTVHNPEIGKFITFIANSENAQVANYLAIFAKDENDATILSKWGNGDNPPVLQVPSGTHHIYCSIFFATGDSVPSGTETTFSNVTIYYKDIEIEIDELQKRAELLGGQVNGIQKEISSMSVVVNRTINTHNVLTAIGNTLYDHIGYSLKFINPDSEKICIFYLGFKNANNEFVPFSVDGGAFSTSHLITIGSLQTHNCYILVESPVTSLNCWIEKEEGGYNNTITISVDLLQTCNLPKEVGDLRENLTGFIGTFISECKSYSYSNALTITHADRLLSIQELVITTNKRGWQSVDWYFNNPVVGKKVNVKVASRINGNNRVATVRCYDCLFDGNPVDNSHILSETILQAPGVATLTIPSNTKCLVVIFSACFGTALAENTRVVLSGISIEYECVSAELQAEVDALAIISDTHSSQIQNNTTDIDDLKNISDLQQSISQYSRDITALQDRLEDLNNSFNDDHTINDNLNPVPIILDTDFGGDVDDVLALRILSYYESIGTVRIMCIGHTGTATNYPKAMSAMLQYDGTMGVPIVLHSSPSTARTGYTETLEQYPHYANDGYPLYGYHAYRKALSELTRKCIMVFVGPYGNLSDLLNSVADEYSELNGVDLISAKVDKIFLMGGSFPDSTVWMNTGDGGVGREWNICANIPASNNVITNCPVPLVFCGWEIGYAVKCGGGISSKLPIRDAMIAAMRTWGGDSTVANGRDGYDPITVAAACLGDPSKMGIELVRGTVNFDTATGYTTFTESPVGNHYYMKLPYAEIDIDQQSGFKKYVNVDYYRIYMNHILGKDWWSANNMCKKDRLT